MDRQHLSSHSSSLIREVSDHSTELNKKRKLLCEHTDSGSPISKQKLENQHVTESAESSENSINSPFHNNVHIASHPSMVPDWSYISSSCCSNEATSSSTFSSSAEFDSTDNFGSGGIGFNGKKDLFKELEALHDPVITELVKSNMVGGEDADANTLDSMLYNNGSDGFVTRSTLSGIMQDGRAGSRQLTIDQEFEQYFSKLML